MKKLILSMAFLGLGVLGFAQQVEQPKHHKGEHLEKMKQELNLTDSQVSQIKALHDKKAEERKQEMNNKSQERMKKMKENDAEMQKILSPEQYKQFQDMKARKMAERQSKFKDRKAVMPNVTK